jgi:hypothetical protein
MISSISRASRLGVLMGTAGLAWVGITLQVRSAAPAVAEGGAAGGRSGSRPAAPRTSRS